MDQLPKDIIYEISSYLHILPILKLALTNRYYYKMLVTNSSPNIRSGMFIMSHDNIHAIVGPPHSGRKKFAKSICDSPVSMRLPQIEYLGWQYLKIKQFIKYHQHIIIKSK